MSSEYEKHEYIVNGVRYERIEDMPPDLQHLFRDADGDGVPDLIERAQAKSGSSEFQEVQYSVNGVNYESMEAMPSAIRSLFSDADGDGLPDIIASLPDDAIVNGLEIDFNGKVYKNIDELPPEFRDLIKSKGTAKWRPEQGKSAAPKLERIGPVDADFLVKPTSQSALPRNTGVPAHRDQPVQARRQDSDSQYHDWQRPYDGPLSGIINFFKKLMGIR